MSEAWTFAYLPSDALPPLAWIAELDGHVVRVRCGLSVRRAATGFVEGTWVGPPEVAALPYSTAVFGSGMVAEGDELTAVPPSHPCERLYFHYDADRGGGRRIVSNSLAAVIATADLTLDPDVLYPPIFVQSGDEEAQAVMDVPTNRAPIQTAVYYNIKLGRNGEMTIDGRPSERPFTSFADFRDRITAALRSAVANAPGYEMVVSLSSGYDSTAVAAVAAQVGCKRAVTFTYAKPVPGDSRPVDNGDATARRLGMEIQSFDRLAYMGRDDLPEAEFLSTGMSGEDVVMIAMEDAITHKLLLTGSEAFRLKGSPYKPPLHRGDLSACSLTEFRLRANFIHLPLLFFGASEKPSVIRVTDSPEMAPWTMPGVYDKPIQRRLAEEAGIPRGTFATVKLRASARIHADGLAAMAPASAAAVTRFAEAEGRAVPQSRRPGIGRRHRFILRAGRTLHLSRFVGSLAKRKRAMIHAEPHLGSLLFRWGVSVVKPRYEDDAHSVQ